MAMQSHFPGPNVVERTPTDASLRWNVLEFCRLLEKLPAGAYMCDPDGLITFFNQRAEDLWGRAPALNDPKDRFCGSFKMYSVDGSPIRHDQCWMALALFANADYNGREIVIERPRGDRRTALAHANPIRDEFGQLLGAVNVLVDITDRKLAEDEQHRLQRNLAHMGRITLAGEMAAGMAHELNQPLTAIVNYGEAAITLLQSGRGTVDELITAMERVVEQGHRAGDIIRHFRDMTRKTTPHRVTVNVNTLIQEAVGFLAAEARQQEVKLRMDLAESLPDIEVDPVQIQQVLVNLICNALEAVSDVEVGIRELGIHTTLGESNDIAVSVWDTGPGISAEIQNELFRPFLTTKPHGMGLGLALSKSIIEAHGGLLWITSETDQRTTLQFTLPWKHRNATGRHSSLPT